MEDRSVFDILVDELSKDERKDLRERLITNLESEADPLELSEETEEEVNLQREYNNLGFFQRVMIILQAWISRRDKLEVVEETIMRRLGKELESKYPDFYSQKGDEFLPGLYNELQTVRSAILSLKPLSAALTSPSRRDFFAFLVGREFPEFQEELLRVTDPWRFSTSLGEENSKDIKRHMEFALEDAFNELPPQDRRRIYFDAKVLFGLEGLCSFPFSKLLDPFSESVGRSGHCGAARVKAPMAGFMDVLAGMSNPPGGTLLETLCIFKLKDKLAEADDESEEAPSFSELLKKEIKKNNDAVQKIRLFSRNVPIVKLVQIAHKDIHRKPDPPSGGEDWFAQLKQFWKERLFAHVSIYKKEKRRENLIRDILSFLKVQVLPGMDWYSKKHWNIDGVILYEEPLGYIHTFTRRQFLTEMNSTLKKILIDGDFYKDQNHREYMSSYNGIVNVYEDIQKLEYSLTPEGELGRQLEEVKQELISAPLRAKKQKAILKKADKAAKDIIDTFIENLQLMENVLKGILYGEKGGRYDTLANIGSLSRVNSQSFLGAVDEIQTHIGQARQQLSELSRIDEALAEERPE